MWKIARKIADCRMWYKHFLLPSTGAIEHGSRGIDQAFIHTIQPPSPNKTNPSTQVPPSFMPFTPPIFSFSCKSKFQWNPSQEDKDDSRIHGKLSLSLRKETILVTNLLFMHAFCISNYMQLMNLLISFSIKGASLSYTLLLGLVIGTIYTL